MVSQHLDMVARHGKTIAEAGHFSDGREDRRPELDHRRRPFHQRRVFAQLVADPTEDFRLLGKGRRLEEVFAE